MFSACFFYRNPDVLLVTLLPPLPIQCSSYCLASWRGLSIIWSPCEFFLAILCSFHLTISPPLKDVLSTCISYFPAKKCIPLSFYLIDLSLWHLTAWGCHFVRVFLSSPFVPWNLLLSVGLSSATPLLPQADCKTWRTRVRKVRMFLCKSSAWVCDDNIFCSEALFCLLVIFWLCYD